MLSGFLRIFRRRASGKGIFANCADRARHNFFHSGPPATSHQPPIPVSSKAMSISRLVAPMGIAALILSGCSQTSAQQRPMPGPADIVATVGSTAITLAQVDEKALQQAASTF